MVIIELKVPKNKWDDFKECFLMTHPNQTFDSDKPLSDNDWIHHRILLFARGSYEKGFKQRHEALHTPNFDKNIIT